MENNTQYAPLPLEFRRNGYTYKQISRTETTAIYEQWYSTKLIAYEIYIIQRQESGVRIMGGKSVVMEKKEFIPSTEQWGKFAWTCRNLIEAQEKLRVISKKQIEARHGDTV